MKKHKAFLKITDEGDGMRARLTSYLSARMRKRAMRNERAFIREDQRKIYPDVFAAG